MFGFGKKRPEKHVYDKDREVPALKSSICTGEQTVGFLDVQTNRFRDVMLVKNPEDIEAFKRLCGVDELKRLY